MYLNRLLRKTRLGEQGDKDEGLEEIHGSPSVIVGYIVLMRLRMYCDETGI